MRENGSLLSACFHCMFVFSFSKYLNKPNARRDAARTHFPAPAGHNNSAPQSLAGQPHSSDPTSSHRSHIVLTLLQRVCFRNYLPHEITVVHIMHATNVKEKRMRHMNWLPCSRPILLEVCHNIAQDSCLRVPLALDVDPQLPTLILGQLHPDHPCTIGSTPHSNLTLSFQLRV